MVEIIYTVDNSLKTKFKQLLHIFPSDFILDNLQNWIPMTMNNEDLDRINFNNDNESNCFVINVNTKKICIIVYTKKKCMWKDINMLYNELVTEYTRWRLASEKDDSSFCLRDNMGRLLSFEEHMNSYPSI